MRHGKLCGKVMATVACDSGSVSEPGKALPMHCLHQSSPNGTVPIFIFQMKKPRPTKLYYFLKAPQSSCESQESNPGPQTHGLNSQLESGWGGRKRGSLSVSLMARCPCGALCLHEGLPNPCCGRLSVHVSGPGLSTGHK